MYGLPPGEFETCSQYVLNLRRSLESAYRIARQNLLVSAHRQKEHYDTKVHGKPFTQDDLVWLCNPAMPRGALHELYYPWTGPYKIVKCLSDLVYRIQDTKRKRKKQVVNFDRLKPYRSRTQDQQITSDVGTTPQHVSSKTDNDVPEMFTRHKSSISRRTR